MSLFHHPSSRSNSFNTDDPSGTCGRDRTCAVCSDRHVWPSSPWTCTYNPDFHTQSRSVSLLCTARIRYCISCSPVCNTPERKNLGSSEFKITPPPAALLVNFQLNNKHFALLLCCIYEARPINYKLNASMTP